jgi:hypothetical protein
MEAPSHRLLNFRERVLEFEVDGLQWVGIWIGSIDTEQILPKEHLETSHKALIILKKST